MSSEYKIPCGEVQVPEEGSGHFDKLAQELSSRAKQRCPRTHRSS